MDDEDVASLEPAQIDPDAGHSANYTLYTVTLTYGSGSRETSQVLSVDEGSASLSYTAAKEYWDLTSTFMSQWSSGSALTFAGSAGNWGVPPSAPAGWTGSSSSPQRDSSVTWLSAGGSPPGTALYAAGNGVDYAIDFSGSAGSPTITWFIYAASQPAAGTYVVPAVTEFDTNAPATQTGYSWWRGPS